MDSKRPSPRAARSVPREACLGQSLVEITVAVAIMGMVLTALVFATTVAVKNADFSKTQAQATRYAQEGMEWLRSQRDQDWDAFDLRAGAGVYCLNNLVLSWPAGPGVCAGFDLDEMFKREVVLSATMDKIQAAITVSWQGRSGNIHQSELESYFTKWE